MIDIRADAARALRTAAFEVEAAPAELTFAGVVELAEAALEKMLALMPEGTRADVLASIGAQSPRVRYP